MNRTEAAYAQLLDVRKAASEIAAWWFEGLTFKLAPDLRYTPDFLILFADGSLECHEVKGFMREDAAIKLKLAAQLFPFKFVLVRKLAAREGGEWSFVEF